MREQRTRFFFFFQEKLYYSPEQIFHVLSFLLSILLLNRYTYRIFYTFKSVTQKSHLKCVISIFIINLTSDISSMTNYLSSLTYGTIYIIHNPNGKTRRLNECEQSCGDLSVNATSRGTSENRWYIRSICPETFVPERLASRKSPKNSPRKTIRPI